MVLKVPRKVLVIGVGRLGGALIDELWENGCDLIVVDKNPDVIEAIKSKASAAFVADATNEGVLENLQARDVDVAVVTAGEAFEGVVMCVSQLVELGVKVIFARAANARQARVLERLGVTRAIQVENEMGHRLAVQVLNPVSSHLLDFATHFRVIPWVAGNNYAGKTLAQANFRRFELNVLGWFGGDAAKPRLNFAAPDYTIEAGHTLLLAGEEEAIERFLAKAEA
ncbi:MAG TPA: TrkA family potassium uptake protein [Polyangiaceae bacterium]|nr:TrkA family potassium uptake protein [Polyangiaceae bacterium]